MADDFYNKNIGVLKGNHFGLGGGSLESQRRLENYYSSAIDPIRKSIEDTEERKMQAERARQIIEAENERRRKAAAEAAAEKAAQEKVEGVFGKVDTILQIEDPVERQAALNQLESSLPIADRQDSKIKAALAMTQQEIDEYEEEIKEQQEAKDSSMEARAKLLTSKGKFKQARDVAKKISDPTKKKEALTTIVDKKPSITGELKSDFAEMTKTATSALSALSKITPSSISPEPEAGLTDSVGEVTESPEVSEGGDSQERFIFDDEVASGGSTRSSNQQIYRAARNAYFTLFGAEEADKLFKDDPDNMTPKELSDLFDTATKKVAEIKRKSRTNKKFFKQFVAGEGVLDFSKKPKNSNTTEPVGNDKSEDTSGSGRFKPGPGF